MPTRGRLDLSRWRNLSGGRVKACHRSCATGQILSHFIHVNYLAGAGPAGVTGVAGAAGLAAFLALAAGLISAF